LLRRDVEDPRYRATVFTTEPEVRRMKRVVRSMRLSIFGLALLVPLGGCQTDNEAGIDSGQKGSADPKYNSDASYESYRKDHLQKEGTGKGKAAPATPKKT
jgi:hypothetical protein